MITIHNHGFEDFYDFDYNGKGDKELGLEMLNIFQQNSLSVLMDNDWGLDYSSWVPLNIMFPK
jgi:aromatic ring-opening dioxygenase catalytic subunit (LigB family)